MAAISANAASNAARLPGSSDQDSANSTKFRHRSARAPGPAKSRSVLVVRRLISSDMKHFLPLHRPPHYRFDTTTHKSRRFDTNLPNATVPTDLILLSGSRVRTALRFTGKA